VTAAALLLILLLFVAPAMAVLVGLIVFLVNRRRE
jgi:hypothetical protein